LNFRFDSGSEGKRLEIHNPRPVTALVGCDSYERKRVEEAVARVFGLLGGAGEFIEPGSSVFIKVNGLFPAAPEKAVTTHPEVLRAVVNELRSVTDRIVIGDSPGGLYNQTMLKRVYNKCGFAGVAEETGASLNYDFSVAQVGVPEAKKMKSITLCGAIVEADFIVSVSKFKTHMSMNISDAVKNLFGTVPGMTKVSYHGRFGDEDAFADLLVDVLLAASPSLNIVDAIEGQDGNGPSRGDLKKMGVLAAGRDAFAVDTLMMGLVGIDPALNKPLAAGIRRGLCSGRLSDVEIVGDDPAALAVDGFRLPTKKDIIEHVPEFIMERFGNMLSMRPRPDAASCTSCGKCAEICPAQAIVMYEGKAKIDSKKCIKCYCCHELCEYGAITLGRPWLMRIARRPAARSGPLSSRAR